MVVGCQYAFFLRKKLSVFSQEDSGGMDSKSEYHNITP